MEHISHLCYVSETIGMSTVRMDVGKLIIVDPLPLFINSLFIIITVDNYASRVSVVLAKIC